MDRTTKWLLRTASLVVILSGIGGISIYLIKSGFLKSSSIKKNEFAEFVEGRCVTRHMGKDHPQTKACKNYLKKLGEEKSKSITLWQHNQCIGKYYSFKNVNEFEYCLKVLAKNPLHNLDGTRKVKPKTKDVFYHKGNVYLASRVCPSNKKMYWVTSGLFKRKVFEMGCMTSEQFKIAKMEMEIKGLKRAIRTNTLNNASNTINNMIQQQQINTNTYNSNFGF